MRTAKNLIRRRMPRLIWFFAWRTVIVFFFVFFVCAFFFFFFFFMKQLFWLFSAISESSDMRTEYSVESGSRRVSKTFRTQWAYIFTNCWKYQKHKHVFNNLVTRLTGLLRRTNSRSNRNQQWLAAFEGTSVWTFVKTSLTFKCLIEHLLAEFSYSRPLDTYLWKQMMKMNRNITYKWCNIDKKHLLFTKRKCHKFSWLFTASRCSPRRSICACRIACKVLASIGL